MRTAGGSNGASTMRGRPHGRPRGWAQLPVFRLKSVEWNPVLVGFLLYIFTIITYFVRLGDAAMVIALVGLLVLGKPLRFPVYLVLFGVYIAWAALGLASTAYGSVVSESLVDYIKLWLIALVAVNALRTRAQVQLYLILVVVWYALFPARGTIVNYVGGYSTVGRALWNHIYANPNDLAALTLLALGAAVALFLSEGDRRIRIGALFSAMVFGGVILMTQSRGAMVAVAVFALLSFRGQQRKLRAFLFLAVCGAVVITIAPSGVWERVQGLANIRDIENLQLVDEEQSAEQRFEIWKVAVNIIADHPLQGVGLGAYGESHSIYAQNRGKKIAFGKRDTHSTYLNVAAETGIVGLSIFLAMFTTVFLHAERMRRRIRAVAPAEADRLWFLQLGLMTYLVAGIFGSFPQLAFLHVFTATVVAAANAAAPGERRQRLPRSVRGVARGAARPVPPARAIQPLE